GLSVSWAMVEAPRQSVMDRVLVPLLAAGPFARRMTLLYEPLSAGAAADEVEREITNTQVRRMWAHKTKRDETQRDRDDLSRAVQSAREEAEGAGVGRFTLYVTTTVFDAEQMPAATADVEQRAGQAKVRLRRLARRSPGSPPPSVSGSTQPNWPAAPANDPPVRLAHLPDQEPSVTTISLPPQQQRDPGAPYRGRPVPRALGGRCPVPVAASAEPGVMWQGTTTQVCGMFPFAVSSGAAPPGCPSAITCTPPSPWDSTRRSGYARGWCPTPACGSRASPASASRRS
ncbi:SCO6880 family protein, partial [Pseudonocardia sp. Ae717_Ps2]|uniref:SCO6880 family protein n=1 Tax=Pseudonocardia sp. Ae717_Ps2 TaxID=1885573 RepID=UPI00350FE5E8